MVGLGGDWGWGNFFVYGLHGIMDRAAAVAIPFGTWVAIEGIVTMTITYHLKPHQALL